MFCDANTPFSAVRHLAARFDNADQSATADVPLTTLHHPKHLVGKWAAEILFDQIAETKHRTPRKILVTPTIVERESVSTRRAAS